MKRMIGCLAVLTVLLLGTLLAAALTGCRDDEPADIPEDTPSDAVTDAPGEPETDAPTEPDTEPETEPETGPETMPYIEREVGQRYLIFRIWNFTIHTLPDFRFIVDGAADAGFNAIMVHIPWTHVEKKDGVYDFSAFDPMIDYVLNEKGMSVAISLDMTRPTNDTLIPSTEIMRNRNGEPSVGSGRMQISFCSTHAVDKAVAFYGEAVSHIEEAFGDTGRILLYIPAFTQYCETEYWCTDDYDYSDPAIKAFRSYCRKTYETVEAMNDALGTKYTSFDEIEAPEISRTRDVGIAWYAFRHEKLKSVIDRLAEVQHSAYPDSKIAIQLGSVFDNNIARRGTIGFADLCENVDVLWCDDAPDYPHFFSTAYVWSSLPARVQLANEIDGPTQVNASIENYEKQGYECFKSGVKYMSAANWNMDGNFHAYDNVWATLARDWLGEDVQPVVGPCNADSCAGKEPVELRLSVSDAVKHGTGTIQRRFLSYLEKGQPCIVVVEDDMFGEK